MNKLAGFLGIYLCSFASQAQSPKGLTSARDTSFILWGTYQKLKDTYPNIRIVESNVLSGVKTETNVVYCRRPAPVLIFPPLVRPDDDLYRYVPQ